MSARVVLAMSGGVDSSAAAVLLNRQGYEVIGLFMRSGATEESVCATSSTSTTSTAGFPIINTRASRQGCCSAADAADARRVADSLDIPFHAINFEGAFERIKDYFVDEYLAGRTPNPCVVCNNTLKFGQLWDFAQQLGADYIATGHYAQLIPGDDNAIPALTQARDSGKDQSYVLFGIHRELLSRILFPVGGHTKPEIRELAREAGLRVADKPDSQEICFIPDNDYAGFVRRHQGHHETAGELVDTSGRVVGHHPGYERFTVGQRKGLGVTFGEPRYVVEIRAASRQVVIGTRNDLARSTLEADGINWLVDRPSDEFSCHAKIRYRHTAVPAHVQVIDDDRLRVTFAQTESGIAPGQAVVLYDGDRVLGGGWIR